MGERVLWFSLLEWSKKASTRKIRIQSGESNVARPR